MGLTYEDLDQRTRDLMIQEINRDLRMGTLFVSENLTQSGAEEYPGLLSAAARDGDDVSLANSIRSRLRSHEKPRKLKSGGLSRPPVMRSNAHEMLAEGEFNRFYMRTLCLRAIEDSVPELVVYRAKAVQVARSASDAMIGRSVPAEALLADLRSHPGVDTALGLPPGPNSGLSARLP